MDPAAYPVPEQNDASEKYNFVGMDWVKDFLGSRASVSVTGSVNSQSGNAEPFQSSICLPKGTATWRATESAGKFATYSTRPHKGGEKLPLPRVPMAATVAERVLCRLVRCPKQILPELYSRIQRQADCQEQLDNWPHELSASIAPSPMN